MQLFSILVVLVSLASAASASPATINTDCKGKQILEHTLIGAGKNVSAEYYSCASSFASGSPAPSAQSLQSTDSNQCGAPCTTTCYTPSGGGPVPNDCQIIADALLYENQNTGPLFTIGIAGNGTTNFIRLTYSTCNTTMVNQTNGTMTYCRSDFAGVTGWIANNCQSTQNAHGGICVANTQQQFFIQVNHS